MNFLSPWFMMGAAAIALPILFHLVRQHIRKRREFSSLMFLKPTPPKIKRRNRVEHWLLLLLRCAMLILLAAAFARPFFKETKENPAAEERGEMIALVVDTSASMNRGSAWSEAKALLESAADEFRNSKNLSVLAFDRQIRAVISFEEWSRTDASLRPALLKERLSLLAPTQAATFTGNAVVTAAEWIEDNRSRDAARDETSRGRIILISDVQQGSHLDGLAGFNWPARVTMEIRSPAYQSPSNAGVHPVAQDPNAVLSRSATNEVRVFVNNSPTSAAEMFKLGWTDGNGRNMQEPENIYLPPGQSRAVRLPVTTNTAASRIVLSGDDEPFDNTAFVVPEEPEQIRVLFVGSADDRTTEQPAFFLKNVFQSTSRQQIEFLNLPDPATVRLAGPPDLLIVSENPRAAGLVAGQLEAGKAVFMTLDQPGRADLLKEILNRPQLAVSEAAVNKYALLGRIDFKHPLFAPFLDARFSDFSQIHFWKHRVLSTNDLPAATVLAAFDNGAPALLEIPAGNGRLFVLTTSWVPSDSRLALSSKFVPLLYSMLELNRPPRQQSQLRLVGDPLQSVTTGTIKAALDPDGKPVDLTTDTAPVFGRAGLYQITLADNSTMRVAVNLDPAESRTSPIGEEEFIRLGVPLQTRETPDRETQLAREMQLKDAETEAKQKNWRWLLAAVVAFFLLESWLAGRLKKTSDPAPA